MSAGVYVTVASLLDAWLFNVIRRAFRAAGLDPLAGGLIAGSLVIGFIIYREWKSES